MKRDERSSQSDSAPGRSTPLAPTMTRRAALGRVLALPLVAALPAGVVACSRGPHCDETGNLSADDVRTRTEIAVYVEKSSDPKKHCSGCVQFQPVGEDECGTCKVVKGPINPQGSCKLFQAKA